MLIILTNQFAFFINKNERKIGQTNPFFPLSHNAIHDIVQKLGGFLTNLVALQGALPEGDLNELSLNRLSNLGAVCYLWF